jgi:hypothetical protein
MAFGLSLAVAVGACSGKGVVKTSGGTTGAGGGGGFVVDPAPADASVGSGGHGTGTGGFGGMVVDPPPPDDAGLGALDVDSDDRAAALGVPAQGEAGESKGPRRLRLIDQWFDTSPKATPRTGDLALYDPPRPRLRARREGDAVVVSVEALRARASARWEAEGEVDGEGTLVRWRPSGPSDRVRVAIRTRGGVAVLSLRAEDVRS